MNNSIISEGIEAVTRCTSDVTKVTGGTLTSQEQAALALLLNSCHKGTTDDESDFLIRECSYRGAVDFLWMAFRISYTQKMDLLELIG